MWFVLQASIMFAVMASNIYWHWTPNVYLTSIIGFVAALLATVALTNLLSWAGKKRRH